MHDQTKREDTEFATKFQKCSLEMPFDQHSVILGFTQ